MMGFYTLEELRSMGVKAEGTSIRVHRSALLFGAENIRLADHVRIDAFSLISAGAGGIDVGRHVHLAAGVYLFGSGGNITLEDFSGLSSRCAVYTASDDYRDGHLTNPTVPEEFRMVEKGDVRFRRHALLGAGCVVLPGVTMGLASVAGALSLVSKDVPDRDIVVGHPARRLGQRHERIFELEARLLAQESLVAR